jgi:hypothetical protein
VVKIDVEGAEFGLLKGMKKTIEKYKPVIILSTHGKTVHADCVQSLNAFGYNLQGVGKCSSVDEATTLLCTNNQ